VTEEHVTPPVTPPGELRQALTPYGVPTTGPQSHLDLPFTDVARQAAAYRAGRVLARKATPHMSTTRWVDRASTPVCRLPVTWVEAGFGRPRGPHQNSLLDLPTCRAPPGRRPRAAQHDRAGRTLRAKRLRRHWATSSPSSSPIEEPRRRFAAMISGLDIRYDLGEDTPCSDAACPTSTCHRPWSPPVLRPAPPAKPVLLNFGETGKLDIHSWTHRVQLCDASMLASGNFQNLGQVTAPAAVLVSPMDTRLGGRWHQ